MSMSPRLLAFEMTKTSILLTLATVAGVFVDFAAASCSQTISASYPAPSLAPGWDATLIANKLVKPRSLKYDTKGHLLVVEQGQGIRSLTLTGQAPCLSVSDSRVIIANTSLNHGIELSPDGKTLYASGAEAVWAWQYDAENQVITSAARRILTIGITGGYSTRTLLFSEKVPGTLVVHWGSQENIDPAAADISNGVSQIRAFDISDTSVTYDFKTQGTVMGWGLRNSVGIAENPVTGGIFSVENNVNNVIRDGVDVHQNNPAEELNFHGFLNNNDSWYPGADYKGKNFGYPTCFPAWNVSEIPNNSKIRTGVQFAQNSTANDTSCREGPKAPVLSFAAHMAPLDLKFNSAASIAYVSFHGSLNRDNPQGYKLSVVEFDKSIGQPVPSSDSMTGYKDIVSNPDLSKCPTGCFRPVGLTWNKNGDLLMASDSTGEIYYISRTDGTPVNDVTPSNA